MSNTYLESKNAFHRFEVFERFCSENQSHTIKSQGFSSFQIHAFDLLQNFHFDFGSCPLHVNRDREFFICHRYWKSYWDNGLFFFFKIRHRSWKFEIFYLDFFIFVILVWLHSLLAHHVGHFNFRNLIISHHILIWIVWLILAILMNVMPFICVNCDCRTYKFVSYDI